MADMDKTEFKFPHEKESAEEEQIEIEIEGEEVKVEFVDDTPEKDRNRPKMTEPPEAVTEEELSKYKDTRLKDRLSHLNKGYHEERRSKEAALRERDEAVFIAQKIIAENEKLKGSVNTNQKVLIEQAKRVVDNEVETAKRAYKTAYEAGDADALTDAQEQLTAAKIRGWRRKLHGSTCASGDDLGGRGPQDDQAAYDALRDRAQGVVATGRDEVANV